MKLLILSVTAGHGHKKTSEALCTAWENAGHDGMILDTYEYIEPFLGKSVDKGYLMTTKYAPKVYDAVYTFLDKKKKEGSHELSPAFSSKEMREKIKELIASYAPDAIVCPHVFTAALMSELKESLTLPPVYGIVTDYTIHPFWSSCRIDGYIIPNELLLSECIRKGMKKETLYPIGIPVSPIFKQPLSKAEAYASLGLAPDKKTVLLMAGSMGYGSFTDIVSRLDSLPSAFQLVVITGNNKRALKALQKKDWAHRMHLYGFVNNVDVFMSAADLLITKPGGLSVSESLVKGLPMVLISPIPGHEKRNMELLTNCGAAMSTSKTCTPESCVHMYLENPWLQENMRQSIRNIQKPNAAEDLVSLLEEKIRRN